MSNFEEKSISLFYKKGTSDKEYRVQLSAQDSGFVVIGFNGRRGSTLRANPKTESPLAYADALKVYDSVVAKQLAKGYTPSESGVTFEGTANEERTTDMIPQLLNPVSREEAMALIDDPEWVMQEKSDGNRRGLVCTGDDVFGTNRMGLKVPVPSPIASFLRDVYAAHGAIKLDGEQVGDVFVLFDIRAFNGVSLDAYSVEERLKVAEQLAPFLSENPYVTLTTTFTSSQQKLEAFNRIEQEQGEGVVFKKLGSPYEPGRPASGGTQLKFKFVESATVVVSKANTNRRSVAVEVYDNGAPVALGNVTIPANYEVPTAGALVEVQYLYAYPNGSLFQPVYKGTRDDLTVEAAVLSQLKFKKAAS